MNRSSDKTWLTRQVAIALMAGAVSIVPQVTYGMPQGLEGASGAVNEVTKTMTVTGTETNNVVGWQDFSIQQDETVHFVGAGKNYLNLVKGQGSSFIDGTLKSDGGNVYLVNPNGVIFGAGAKVNVGAGTFAASTQAIDTIDQAAFGANGTCVLSAAGTTMDVVNLIDPTKGYIKANRVEMAGRNIRFMNTDSIQTTGATVNLHSNTDAAVVNAGNGYVHVGYDAAVGDSYTAPVDNTKSPITLNWQVNGAKATEANAYMLVKNAAQLQHMKDNTDGNYMLGGNVTLTGTFTPIPTFSGNFDGNFFTIYDLNVNATSGDAGLFAKVDGGTGVSRIENVLFGKKVSGTNISASTYDYAGVVAGVANNALFQNIGIKEGGQVAEDASDEWMSGGIVGSADDVIIRSSYNEHTCRGGGIVGTVTSKTKIYDVYNTGKVQYGIIGSDRQGAIIERVYSTQADKNKMWADWAGYATKSSAWDKIAGNLTNGYFYFSDTPVTNAEIGLGSPYKRYDTFIHGTKLQNMPNESLTPWGVAHISADGGARTTWRIHSDVSGQPNLPTLTAFYRGIVAVKYHYTMGESANPTAQSGNNWEQGYNPKAVYNKQDIKLDQIQYSYEDTASPIKTIDDKPVVGGAMDTGKHDVNYSGDHLSPYTLFRSDEYDVAGGNFTIEQREVIGTADGEMEVAKEYDGTAKVNYAGKLTIPATGDSGVIAGDEVNITGSITGTYYKSKELYEAAGGDSVKQKAAESADAGTNKYAVVNFNSVTLSNKNYKLNVSSGPQTSTKGKITPKKITITNPMTGPTKVYDGTTNLPTGWDSTLRYEESAVIADDAGKVTLSHSGSAPSYASANAGTQDFTYSGIRLAGDKAYNYQLVDSKGNVVYYQGSSASPPTLTDFTQKTDGKYTIQGTITPRAIDPKKFQDLLADGALKDANKVYDGSAAYTANDGMTGKVMANVDGVDKGVIAADQGRLRFTVNHAKFNRADATANAGATEVTYNVNISADEEALLKNYTLNGSTLDTYTAATEVGGRGTIAQRTLAIGMKKATGVDKEYDGDATVKGTAANGYLTFGGANGYVGYADGSQSIVGGDDATFKVEAAYQATNGENAADVNRGANRAVLDKDVKYTVKLEGTKAGNYIVQAGGAGTGQQATLSAKGKITPVALTLTAGNTIQKTYDGTTDAYKDGAWVGTVTQSDPGWTLKKKSDGSIVSGLTVSWSQADYNNENVKHANQVTFSGVHVDSVNYDVVGADGNAASLASVAVTGKINPKAIALDDVKEHLAEKGYRKEYDGKKAIDASVVNDENVVSFTLSGLVEKDKGKVKVKATGADFDNKNAGTGKTITYHLIASVADGVDPDFAENYTFGGTPLGTVFDKVLAGKGTIDKRTLKATVNGTERKVYDGTEVVNARQATFGWAADGNRIVKSEGAATLDDVVIDASAVVGTYDGKNAGTNHTVNYTGLKLTGGEAGNYQLEQTAFTGAVGSVIDRRGIKVAFKTGTNPDTTKPYDSGIDKVYDGDKKLKGSWSDLAHNLELQQDSANPGTTGIIGGDSVAFSASRAAYQDENVAWDDIANSPKEMDVYYSGFSTKNQNYYIINENDTLTGKGTIKPKQIGADDVKAQGTIRKVYDTTKAFAPSGSIPGTVNGKIMVNGEETTDTNRLVGFDAAQAELYKNLKVKVKKITYQDANVVNNNGMGKVDVEVEVTGTGGAATSHNYAFTGGGTVTKTFNIGTITPANVTVSFAKVTKEYDGNTNVPPSLVAPTVTGQLGSDSVSVAGGYRAAFESEKVKGKQGDGQNHVNYSGLALTNANYQLVDAEGTVITATTGAGEIKPRKLTDADVNTAFQIANATKVYDGTAKVKYGDSDSLTDENGVRKYVTNQGAFQKDDGKGLGNQEIHIGYTITSAAYQDNASRPASYVGSGDKTVKYAFKLDTENFDLSALTGVAADGTFSKTTTTNTIKKKTVMASLNQGNFDKTYNGNDRVSQDVTHQIRLEGLTGNDGVGLDTDKINAHYQSKNVAVDTSGKAKAQDIYYTAALKGEAAVNYDLQGGDANLDGTRKLTGQGTIKKAALTATIGYAEKTYDGTNQVTSVPGVALTGFVGGESFQYSTAPGITGTYDDADVNRAKSGDPVGYKGVTYKGLNQALREEKIQNKVGTDVHGSNYEVTTVRAVNGESGGVNTLADTVYFSEAAKNGKIKPLAITNAAVTWDAAPIVKTYDGSTQVIEAEKYLKLKAVDGSNNTIMVGGNAISIAYELESAAYDNKNAGVNKAVTYKVKSLNAELNKNYDLAEGLVATINGKLETAGKTGTINRKLLQVTAQGNGIIKTYDGTNTVPGGVTVEAAPVIQGDNAHVTITNLHYTSTDANADPDGNVLFGKTKVGYVAGNAVLSGADQNNYTLSAAAEDPSQPNVTTKTFNIAGEIRQRVVYVDFKAGKGTATTNHKVYDGNAGLGHDAGDDVELQSGGANTGVVGTDDVHLDTTVVKGQYANKNVARKADGTVTTKEVYYDNFQLTGSKAGNYAVQAAPGKQKGNDKTTLVGQGIIRPKTLHVTLKHDTGIDKVYDGTAAVTGGAHLKSNLNIQTGDLVGSDTIDSIGLDVSAVYRENPVDASGDEVKDAGKNGGADNALGVDYILKWTGGKPGNYELAQFSLKGKGKITRRTLTYAGGAVPTTTKVYDGTDAVKEKDAAKAFANAFNDAVYKADYAANPNIAVTTARYTDGVNASVDNQTAASAPHTVDYTITLQETNAYGTSNFALAGATDAKKLQETKTGTGTITRRTLHMDVPAVVEANGTAAEPVPTLRPAAGDTGIVAPDAPPTVAIVWSGGKTWAAIRNTPGVYAYQWVASDGSKAGLYGLNYMFAPGTMTVKAPPVVPNPPPVSPNPPPVVPNIPPILPDGKHILPDGGQVLPDGRQVLPDGTLYRVEEGLLGDIGFKPDHLSYQRSSRDWDASHFYRMSGIELRHEKSGINLSRVPLYGEGSRIGVPVAAQERHTDVSRGLSDLSAYGETEPSFSAPTEVVREAAAAIEVRGAGVNHRGGAAADEAAPMGLLASLVGSPVVSDVPAALGIRIHAQEEDVDEETLMAAEPDRDLRIGIETMGGAVNMMAMR
ncbi:MAG: YDG domain-containing protein [Schwartzia sp. (in: firmicutes)]